MKKKQKKSCIELTIQLLKKGNYILSHISAVPSAQVFLTSLFGMGRGEPHRYCHLKLIDYY